MDCVTVDPACHGGLMSNGCAFAEKNAMCSENSYSYTETEGTYSDPSCTVELAQGSVTGFRR